MFRINVIILSLISGRMPEELLPSSSTRILFKEICSALEREGRIRTLSVTLYSSFCNYCHCFKIFKTIRCEALMMDKCNLSTHFIIFLRRPTWKGDWKAISHFREFIFLEQSRKSEKNHEWDLGERWTVGPKRTTWKSVLTLIENMETTTTKQKKYFLSW